MRFQVDSSFCMNHIKSIKLKELLVIEKEKTLEHSIYS